MNLKDIQNPPEFGYPSKAQALIRGMRLRLERLARENPRWELALLALSFAETAHRTQTRNDGKTPYIVHPVRVALQLQGFGPTAFDVELTCAALLHDALEDCPVTKGELLQLFSPVVVDTVVLLTKNPGQDPADYYEAIGQSTLAALCKAADRLDNLRGASDAFALPRLTRYLVETQDLLMPAVRRLVLPSCRQDCLSPAEADPLDRPADCQAALQRALFALEYEVSNLSYVLEL